MLLKKLLAFLTSVLRAVQESLRRNKLSVDVPPVLPADLPRRLCGRLTEEW